MGRGGEGRTGDAVEVFVEASADGALERRTLHNGRNLSAAVRRGVCQRAKRASERDEFTVAVTCEAERKSGT
eukprot:3899920-Rhodomonas_salina.1